jgi:hypothetical protein
MPLNYRQLEGAVCEMGGTMYVSKKLAADFLVTEREPIKQNEKQLCRVNGNRAAV